ncbi:MAG: hypothetical protein Kow00124_19610 [Anaerolineae bacterium]
MGLFDPFDDETAYDQPATLEVVEDRQPTPRRSSGAIVYNTIALFFVAATIAVCLYTILLIQNPVVPYNPFPPPPPLPTPTLFLLPGMEDPAGQSLPETESGVETPAAAPPSGATAAALQAASQPTAPPTAALPAPLSVPSPTPTTSLTGPVGGAVVPTATYPFALQSETISYQARAGDAACRGTWIAGQVFGQSGEPITGLPILITGEDFQEIQVSGTAEAYGPSGFAVQVTNSLLEAEFEVKLVNPTNGQDLSEPVIVRTRSTCDESVAIINFVQVLDIEE